MSVGQKLVGQMQKLTSEDVYGANGSMDKKIAAGSAGMKEIQHDPDIIKFMEFKSPELVQSAKADFYKTNPPEAPLELPRQVVFEAITLAYQGGDSPDVEEQALIDKVREKTQGVYENPYLRQNCYAFAVEGANIRNANPMGIGAIPGNVNEGLAAIDGKTDSETIIRRVTEDGAIPAGSDPSKLDIPKGMRLVAMYEDPGHDYHFNRIDLSADGKQIAMTGKNGIIGHEDEILQRTYDVDEAFDPDKSNVMNYSSKYEFKQFFYVPEKGLNVGMDAHLIKQGKLEAIRENEHPLEYAQRVDVATFLELHADKPAAQVAEAQGQKVENVAMSPAELQNRVAGVEPLGGSFPGQKQDNIMQRIMQHFSSMFTAEGPSNERDVGPQQNQMNRNPGLSGPGLSMGA